MPVKKIFKLKEIIENGSQSVESKTSLIKRNVLMMTVSLRTQRTAEDNQSRKG